METKPSIRTLEEILDREGSDAVRLSPDGAVIRKSEDLAWAKGMEDAALLAEEMACDNDRKAADLHRRSNRQAQVYDDEVAEQTQISAQVLDNCAAECRSVAVRIRERIAFITNRPPQANVEK